MPPRRPARPAAPDVEALRASLQQGKIVRVGIAPSDQFPDGVTGRVRRIGDPAVDGRDFIFVEVPVGGAKDVLPFAATDLIGSPARKPRAARPTRATPAGPGATPTGPGATPTGPGATPAGAEIARVGPRAGAARGRPARGKPATGGSPTPPDSDEAAAPALLTIADLPAVAGEPNAAVRQLAPTEAEPTVAVIPASRQAVTASKNSAAARGKRAPVTITISTAGGESSVWRVEAKIGVRAAVRPTVVPPSRVWEIVKSLGEPALTSVVESLLADHRRSTQARADALAAELSSLQLELMSFPDRDSS